MDSMRTLNTSLPGVSPSKSQNVESAEDLLNAFKAAALSVTKLYKTAAEEKGRARTEGYQDALDELLAFLDKEDIGLSDGEGWRIRAWATERLDGRDNMPQNADSEDESGEKMDRSTSPEFQRSQSATRLSAISPGQRTSSPTQTESQTPSSFVTPTSTPTTNESAMMPPQGLFTFRSAQSLPQDPDITLSNLVLSDSARAQHDASAASNASNVPITVTRPRPNNRHNTHSGHTGRSSSRSSSSASRGTDKKRKLELPDFFDISNSSFGKDGLGGGGKRGRFI